MTELDVRKDPEALTMAITAEYAATPEQVWQLWADPRKLERWWGPPTWPATVTDHDLVPGGLVRYVMTGPDGEKAGGLWEVVSVDAPRRLELLDLFADETGAPNRDMPTTRMTVAIDAAEGGRTRMVLTSTFASLEAMEQLVAMGMEDGIRAAMSQIDELLAA